MPVNPDVNFRLKCAIREGRLDRVSELIHSFGLSCTEACGYVLLRNTVKENQQAMANLLLKLGCEVNSKSVKPTDTPLHFAVLNDDIEIVKMMLNRGANINAKNQTGTTPLHIATRRRAIEVTELLLSRSANVNITDIDGRSPLHSAATDCLQIVDHLLKYGADVNCVCTSRGRKRYTSLHFATEKGNKEIVTMLLSRGAIVDVKGENDITPLHIAAQKGYIHIVEDLLNHGASTHSFTLNEGYTPLHFACQLGEEETVELFLKKGADINASMNGNLTPLLVATEKGRNPIVKLLLQNGAKVDSQDKDGKTALYLAVNKGYLTIVEDILKYSPDINNQSNQNTLKIAAYGHGKDYLKIVKALLEYGFSVNPEDVNDPQLLHSAVEKGYLNIIDELLKYGADVNTKHCYKKDFTLLHSSVEKKQLEITKLLISYEADVNAQNDIRKTPIFYAVENADLKIVEVLLQHNADVNASDMYGRTALHFTAISKNAYPVPTKIQDDINIKAEIAKLLLSKGANVDAQTKGGETTLQAAIKNGYAKVVEVLLKYNANINSALCSDIPPLHLSAQMGNVEISTMLLNKGVNVNATRNGIAALHIAAYKGHNEVVKALLECGAVDFEIKSYSCITPIKGCLEIIEASLRHGATTALHIAAEEGNLEVVITLLEYGSDINITGSNNITALRYAMVAVGSFYNSVSFEDFDPDRGVHKSELTFQALERHIVKMKNANLYVSEKNLQSIGSSEEINSFQCECDEEVARMKSEKINNTNISFYDILAKGISSLRICMRNENIVRVLKLDDYKAKFPIYASMIKNNFRKAMERKELLEKDNKIFNFLFNNFPELPYDCIEKIFSYLSNEDLKSLMNACKNQH